MRRTSRISRGMSGCSDSTRMEGTESCRLRPAPPQCNRGCSDSTCMEGTESEVIKVIGDEDRCCSDSTRLEGTERCASVTIMPGTENPLEGFQLLSLPIHPLMKVIHSHFCIERIDSNLVELERTASNNIKQETAWKGGFDISEKMRNPPQNPPCEK